MTEPRRERKVVTVLFCDLVGFTSQAEHRRAHAVIRTIFDHLVERGEEPEAIVDFVAGMTDRFALQYADSLGS